MRFGASHYCSLVCKHGEGFNARHSLLEWPHVEPDMAVCSSRTHFPLAVIFNVYDTDGDGKVSTSDIVSVLKDLTGTYLDDKQREVRCVLYYMLFCAHCPRLFRGDLILLPLPTRCRSMPSNGPTATPRGLQVSSMQRCFPFILQASGCFDCER